MSVAGGTERVVLDTNVVLDLLVFEDPSTAALKAALAAGTLVWVATPAMRDELQRVLGYPKLARRLQANGLSASTVLARFDQSSQCHPPAPRCPVSCSDRDDQMFIDLAMARQALLLSKDDAVLRLRKRLVERGVPVRPGLTPAA